MPFDANFFSSLTMIHWVIIILLIIAVYQLITAKTSFSLSSLSTLFSSKSLSSGGILQSFSTDFTHLAQIGKIDPIIGRTDEIIRLAQVLSRRGKNNAILVGPPGVGKTAIVEALAQRIVSGEVPETLKGKRVLALDVATLMSGTKYRGEFEKRAKKVVQEIEAANRSIILFIDEIHTLIQSQGTEGAMNFSDILKPALARGDLQMIGATTWMEYEKYIKTDAALERRFQPVHIEQPSVDEAIQILQGVKEKYKTYHKVEFTDAALEAAVKLTDEAVKHRTLPDKAIDAVDEAASMVRVSHVSDAAQVVLLKTAEQKHPDVQKLWSDIQSLDAKLFQETNPSKKQILQTQREELENKIESYGVLSVDVSDIETVVHEWIDETKL